MFSKVKWRRRGEYSGPLIIGSQRMQIPKNPVHYDRISILTSLVESGGKLGTVMAYDGTGMTGGLIQCVAIFPAQLKSFSSSSKAGDSHGPLWTLIEKINNSYPDVTQKLIEEFQDSLGWGIKNGKVINLSSGEPVSGRDIRHELTPPHGKVPKYGEDWDSAKGWALIFHDIFSDPRTEKLQIEESRGHFISFQRKRWSPLKGYTIDSLLYKKIGGLTLPFEPIDLAIAVFHSFAVNSPHQALVIFWDIFKETVYKEKLSPEERTTISKALIRKFKNSIYGNWDARYERTRSAAQKIWPAKFFSNPDSLMP